jgi:hypothetical protein
MHRSRHLQQDPLGAAHLEHPLAAVPFKSPAPEVQHQRRVVGGFARVDLMRSGFVIRGTVAFAIPLRGRSENQTAVWALEEREGVVLAKVEAKAGSNAAASGARQAVALTPSRAAATTDTRA